MSYTLADFRRDFLKIHLKRFLELLSVEEIVKALPPEEIVKALPPEEIVKALPPEERLKGLSAEEIERYLRSLKANTSSGDTSAAPE